MLNPNTSCPPSVADTNIRIPVITIPDVIFNQLQHQNQILKQENSELRQQAVGLANARIDYLKKWESCQATIEGLQKENSTLRRENQELRAEISILKQQISELSATQSIMMKSYERENKLALLKMFDDAKNHGLEHFSTEAQNYVKAKSVKNRINSAAHVFEPLRVKDAIGCQSIKTKTILLSMWKILYDVNDESDDSDCEVGDLQ